MFCKTGELKKKEDPEDSVSLQGGRPSVSSVFSVNRDYTVSNDVELVKHKIEKWMGAPSKKHKIIIIK